LTKQQKFKGANFFETQYISGTLSLETLQIVSRFLTAHQHTKGPIVPHEGQSRETRTSTKSTHH